MIPLRRNAREILARRSKIHPISGTRSQTPSAGSNRTNSKSASEWSNCDSYTAEDDDDDIYCPSWLKDRQLCSERPFEPDSFEGWMYSFFEYLERELEYFESMLAKHCYCFGFNTRESGLVFGEVCLFENYNRRPVHSWKKVVGKESEPPLQFERLAEIDTIFSEMLAGCSRLQPTLLSLHTTLPLKYTVIGTTLRGRAQDDVKSLVLRPLEQVFQYPRYLTALINLAPSRVVSDHCKSEMLRTLRTINQILTQLRDTNDENMVDTWAKYLAPDPMQGGRPEVSSSHDLGGTFEVQLRSADDLRIVGCKTVWPYQKPPRENPHLARLVHHQTKCLVHVRKQLQGHVHQLGVFSREQLRYSTLWTETMVETRASGNYIASMYECFEQKNQFQGERTTAAIRQLRGLIAQISRAVAAPAICPEVVHHLQELATLVWSRFVEISRQWYAAHGSHRHYTVGAIASHYQQSFQVATATIRKM
ncbi:uncharacterized protein CANTADRAFT_339950 [Suhomyces tanzawaensis NRRL Y-17324]|uniref:DH domain-containing protein n=1 Tax=Suhomyces tanzawaensis NRRL Y-17324 TaxID=984487 RepID=A0A1E4SCZ1_9ASCO|nr:uncharacterized protein CANTADRAFT_339950 [Suhomyces tanzawaensis NRRL Y-17324]ODV77252.1 hypothetical protein CANTADRAFT_339950 [Suhomyces tanzawaensis NRRL Y-17324]